MTRPSGSPDNAREQPVFYDLLYSNRNPSDVDLLTTVHKAAEAITGLGCASELGSRDITNAVARTVTDDTFPTDYSGFQQIVEEILRLVERDSKLAGQLNAFPAAFGDGAALRALFINLFQDQSIRKIVDLKGKEVLTGREVEVLRMAAAEYSQQQIAEFYGIAKATVRKHLNNIYKTLDVHSPISALRRAAAMGYVEWGCVEELLRPAKAETPGFNPFHDFCTFVGDMAPTFGLAEMRPLATFGLLLLAVSGAVARQCIGDSRPDTTPHGLVCRINARGEVKQRFGWEHMRTARVIAVAPHNGVDHGFTPGNIFVAHDQIPQQRLNRGAISEFTPNGEYVRTFCGGDEINTRLIGTMSVCFSEDGRLLVSSGWLTHAILAFSAGGNHVERFAEEQCMQICRGHGDRLYTTEVHPSQSVVKILDSCGQSLGVLCAAAPLTSYRGITTSGDGRIYIVVRTETRDLIEEFDENGVRLRTLLFSAGRIGRPAVDDLGRLILPCTEPSCVLIVGQDGSVQRTIALGEGDIALSAAVAEDGDILVCGGAP